MIKRLVAMALVLSGASCGSPDEMMNGFGGGKASEGQSAPVKMYGLSPTEFFNQLKGVSLSGRSALDGEVSLTIDEGTFVLSRQASDFPQTSGRSEALGRELLLQGYSGLAGRVSGFVTHDGKPAVVLHFVDAAGQPTSSVPLLPPAGFVAKEGMRLDNANVFYHALKAYDLRAEGQYRYARSSDGALNVLLLDQQKVTLGPKEQGTFFIGDTFITMLFGDKTLFLSGYYDNNNQSSAAGAVLFGEQYGYVLLSMVEGEAPFTLGMAEVYLYR